MEIAGSSRDLLKKVRIVADLGGAHPSESNFFCIFMEFFFCKNYAKIIG